MASHQAFPDVTEKKKDESYHKQAIEGIVNGSISSSYDIAYASMNENINFYNGLDTGQEFKFLQESEDGTSLPAQWINFNKIKVKIDLLAGELARKGYDINVKALNKDAVVRKLEEKKRLMVEMRAKEIAQDLESMYGMPLQTSEYVPESEEELDEYFNYTYKEVSEIIVESALKYLARENGWDYQRIALFRDILINGRAFAKCEIVNGMPSVRRIDPRFMIWDTAATDDFLSDASFFGEVRYMNIGDAAQRYNLSEKEVKDAYKRWNRGQAGPQIWNSSTSSIYNIFNDSSIKWFRNDEGETRVLVISAVWVDYKTIKNKVSVDKYGYEHIKSLKDDVQGENIVSNKVKVWRQGTLIGGEFLKEWGEVKNQVRDLDNLRESKCPYKALLPNYFNGNAVSKVDQLKGLQKLKDITMYNVQLAMSRAGAKGFIYDVAQMPEEWEVEDVLAYLKTAGIAFINSAKDGLPANFNQFQQFDMTLSQSVNQYLEINMMIDKEMDTISGITEARQGNISQASQAVGVTQSSLFQSSLATESIFNLFSQFSANIFTHLAGLVKLTWTNKERYAYIIGDTGVDFINTDIDIALDDYGVFIDVIPPVLDDIQMFNQIVLAALQSGNVDFIDALKILREKDIDLAIRRFEKTQIERQKLAMAMQEREAAQQREMQMMNMQMQSEATRQEKLIDGDLEERLLALKNKGAMANTALQIKGGLAETALKGDIDIKKEKAKPKPAANKSPAKK